MGGNVRNHERKYIFENVPINQVRDGQNVANVVVFSTIFKTQKKWKIIRN